MKKTLYFAVLLISFQSCMNEEKTKSDCKEINYRLYINIDSLNKEAIEYDSLKIYGKYPLKQTEKEIVARFGKKFKIYQNYRKDEKTLDYGFIKFTLNEGFYYCNYIELFDTDLTVYYHNIILNKKTLISDIVEIFPNTFKMSQGGGTTFQGILYINGHKSGSDFDKWALHFGHGRLRKMILISPLYN
jgi:hypothetical protein